MGRRQRPALVLVVVAFFWTGLLLGLAAASSIPDFKPEGADRHGEELQPGYQSHILQFGSGNNRGSPGSEQNPDLTNIKRVLEDKRDRREKASRDSDDVFALKQRVAKDSSGGADDSVSEAGILGTLSEEGLEYVKEVLVGEILEEVTPLQISDINSRVNSPIGRLDMSITNIFLVAVDVYYSDIELGPNGITIYAAGIQAILEARWEYHYTASYVPFPVGDGGHAEVKVLFFSLSRSLSEPGPTGFQLTHSFIFFPSHS